ncbi:protein bax [Kushneria indalinina]|uniref:Bax protein n=1 Tax=Kushneria indalinina DSM 14324 TaxID=1122140 RepID=A0A3D9DZ56_9GAMM|nr:protein bax [Kushneria indalinina]REC95945.1 Bax protein [Kushneria indalinina DSM 14324]
MTRTHRPLTTLTLVLALSVFSVFTPSHADSSKPSFHMPDLREHPAGSDRKIAFFNLMIPLIEKANDEIQNDREWLSHMREQKRWTVGSRKRLAAICDDYGLSCNNEKNVNWSRLFARVDTVPIQLVLIQAVEESGWGTSRFAREGNNLFGMRCFGNNCGLEQTGTGSGYQSFATVYDGIEAYMRNLNTHRAYEHLRERRAALRDKGKNVNALALIPSLQNYSIRGDAYLAALQSLLNTNAPLIEEMRVQDSDDPA